MKKSKPFEIDWSNEAPLSDLEYNNYQQQIGYKRALRHSALCLFLTAFVILCIYLGFHTKPDYTMTLDMYQNYINQCALQSLTQTAPTVETTLPAQPKPTLTLTRKAQTISAPQPLPTQSAYIVPIPTQTAPIQTLSAYEQRQKAICAELGNYLHVDTSNTANWNGCVALYKAKITNIYSTQAHTPAESYELKRLLAL